MGNKPLAQMSIASKNQFPYLVTGEELLQTQITKIPCLWEPFIMQQGLISMTGSSDVGKSSFLRQLAISVVLKMTTFLGHPLNVRHGRALYLATEDSKITVQFTLQRSIDLKTIKPNQLQGLCFLINPDNPYNAIEEQLKIAPTDLVIVDSYGDVFQGNINDNIAVRMFLNKYQKLSEKYDTLFIFLHHTGKRTENNSPSKNNAIGSQGFEAKMRLQMELRKPDSSNRRELYFVKGNALPDSVKSQALQLTFDSQQQFHYNGSINNFTKTNRQYSDEEKLKILSIAKPLKEQGHSFDSILSELSKNGLEKVPSKGKLFELIKE